MEKVFARCISGCPSVRLLVHPVTKGELSWSREANEKEKDEEEKKEEEEREKKEKEKTRKEELRFKNKRKQRKI